jgi:hypothetical protein
MKYSIIVLFGLVLAVSSAPTQDKLLLQPDFNGVLQAANNLLQPIIAAAINSTNLLTELTTGFSKKI